MKVGVIFTGGTIGSTVDEMGYIGPKGDTPFRVLAMYREQFETDVEFEVLSPYTILSENLAADHIVTLAQTVNAMLQREDMQGVIVTHGTDTLQYGSAMMGYLFGNAQIPIVVVSSNYVLDDIRANGLINFRYAVDFIKGQYGTGVFVSYCNQGELPTIHRATRLQPLIPYSDYVGSVRNMWYGRFENGHYISNTEYHVKDGRAAILENVEAVRLTAHTSEIMFLHPYVGMEYPEIKEGTKVVLHGSYHSGTICVTDGLTHFMEDAMQRNVPVFLTGLLSGEKAYETVKEYICKGLEPLHTSSEVAQYCKLWLALSNGLDVKEVMGCSIAEDWI